MATNTTNYNLVKPNEDDFYDIEVQNDNMDIIDEELGALQQQANEYTIPTASTTELGGIKVGTNLSMEGDVLNAIDTTYTSATTTTAGLMSATDKSKLDGIATGAEVNVNADWNATSGDAQILNKPTALSEFTNDSGYQLSAELEEVSNTEIDALFV